MKTSAASLSLTCIASLLLTGCFGVGMTFDRNWRERDPVGYKRKHEQDRLWLVDDANKHGYKLHPSEYDRPTTQQK